MGLMQLLTVGRSLSEAKDQPHRYKLRTEGWPKFGHESAAVGQSGVGDSETCSQNAEKTMSSQTVADKSGAPKPAYPRGRWTAGVNPFKSQGAAARPSVQGELSLDKVKPVRNDLSDTDLELIAVKPAAEPVAAKPEEKRLLENLARFSWG